MKTKKIKPLPDVGEMSKSKMEKFLRCPFSYDQHYNKRVRPCKVGSALIFGIGIDSGLNEMLAASKTDPVKAFRDSIEQFPLGKMTVGRYDYDKDLLTDKDKETALTYCKSLGYKGDDPDGLFKELMEKEKLSKKQEQAVDYLARVSFAAKARILFDAYKKQIMPRIKKVLAIQKSVGAGILDLVAVWDDDKTYVIDNKTATNEYEQDEADYSVQLTSYAIEEKIDNTMFIVLPKRIDKDFVKTCKTCGHKASSSHQTCNAETDGKRCGGEWSVKIKFSVQIQVVTGEVTELMKKRTKEIQKQVRDMTNTGNFPCNFANCGNMFGKPCEYRDLYWKGKMDGLEEVKGSGKKK